MDLLAEAKMLLENVPQVSDDFEILEKIGEGNFSKVFKARLRGTDQEYALKHIIPTSLPSRIESELRFLLQAGGEKNVMEVSTCVMNKGHFVLVMPYFAHDNFFEFVSNASVDDTRIYMFNLFLALQRIHELGIVHRDVKAGNFLFNRKLHKYSLVDFGLAQRQEDIDEAARTDLESRGRKLATVKAQVARKRTLGSSNAENEPHRKNLCLKGTPLTCESGARVLQPLSNGMSVKVHPASSQAIRKPSLPIPCNCYGKNTVCTYCLGRTAEVAPRAGTPGFRAPEVLLKYKAQTSAIDVWASGVLFLSILSGRYPFFKATDDLTALAAISTLLGTERMQQVAENLGKKLTTTLQKPSMDLKMLCQKSLLKRRNGCVFPDTAYDLLSKLLDPNPHSRITATRALQHDFFKGLNSTGM